MSLNDKDNLPGNNKSLESELISRVTHKLRTPLTAIALALELLERELSKEADEKTKKYLVSIGDSVKEMTELIESLSAIKK